MLGAINLELPLWATVLVFIASAAAIGVGGAKLAKYADRLADRTGLGEALTGTMFLGFLTALPGVAASVTAALQGHPAMAVSNAMGGIAVQTSFLAVADLVYRRANLEHAAASLPNMIQTGVLIALLTLALLGLSGPDATLGTGYIHPMTLLLFAAAGFGFYLAWRSSEMPMWRPRQTAETREDKPDPDAQRANLTWLIVGLIVSGLITLAASVFAAEAAGDIATRTDLSESVVGGIFLAIATSLPELVTTVAAVRRGALTLAVSDIVGGNFFDVLFVCFADLAYLQGSIYHAAGVGLREIFLTGLCILMNVVFLLGLLYRQEQGPARIGFESVLLILLYLAGMLVMALAM